jgi:glycerol-3-phosphate dehydrogenase
MGAGAQLDTRLWATYGVAAAEIIATIKRSPTSAEAIGELEELTPAEVGHAVRFEMAIALDDVLRRRSRVGMFRTADACAAAGAVAEIMAGSLGWSAEKIERETHEFRQARLRELRIARGEMAEDADT